MKQRFKRIWPSLNKKLSPVRVIGATALCLGLAIAVGGSLYHQNTVRHIIEEFYANASTELISIGLTVLLINWLYERRDEKREKDRLIHQLGIWDNTLARWAADELRRLGWLQDGTLHGINLIGAQLETINLSDADLRNARFDSANLRVAFLHGANLRGASFSSANLEGAVFYMPIQYEDGRTEYDHADLHGAEFYNAVLFSAHIRDEDFIWADVLRFATMPDGRKYDGRYRLDGDLQQAKKERVDINEPKAMAEFYDVDLEDYLEGQEWAQENLPKLGRQVGA